MKKYTKPTITLVEISNHQSLLTTSPNGSFDPKNGGKVGGKLAPDEDWD